MGTRFLAGIGAGVVLVVASACGGGGGAATSAPTGAPTGAPATSAATSAPSAVAGCTTSATEGEEVVIFEFKFDPADLTVPAGTAVAWTNGDSAAHTVTFDGGPDCGRLAQGEGVGLDFDTPGTYEYFCKFHGSMQGTITVE